MASEAKHTPFAAEDLAYLRERGFVQTAEGIEQLTAQRDAALVAVEEAKKALEATEKALAKLQAGGLPPQGFFSLLGQVRKALSSLPTAQVTNGK